MPPSAIEEDLIADKPKAPTPSFEELFRALLKIKAPMAPDPAPTERVSLERALKGLVIARRVLGKTIH
jgi:hypothetical protein